jgi:cyclic peptide transporter
VGATLAAYLLSVCFPEKDRFRQKAPSILLMSVLSGLSNMLLIILVTTALEGGIELKFLIFYYALTILVYLAGRKYVQTQLIKFTRDLIYDLRIKLLDKIFSTSYQKFEKMDRGRIYTALNDDVGTIGESANMFVMLTTNLFTAAGAFVYLASMAFWATVLTLLLVGAIATLYFVVSRSTNVYFEQARDTRDVFMRLLNGMIDGFKELSLHRNKKLAYKADVAHAANEYRVKISTASIRFVNAFLVGESMLLVLLGAVVFAIPVLFPGIRFHTVMGFVIVLLYLIGPINGILSSVPAVMRIRIAWNRIQRFLREIPATLDLNEAPRPVAAAVESIRAAGVRYQYKHKQDQDAFTVGPIDLEVRAGEILFLVGGNGSGKTTLAKLLTGLYEPDAGAILINDKAVGPAQLSEHFSVVFSPAHLFEKLYNVDTTAKAEAIEKYLGVLDLGEKVQITGNRYNTIQLSGGQVKRLALLQCYLEDSPVYLFDEWAADQDPAYRHFFYRTLLPEMRKAGKIVIAITHDDHYFDVADKLLKMKHGKLEAYTNTFSLTGIAAG